MLVQKLSFKKLVGFSLVAGAFLATASAQASIIKDGILTPVITAGAPPDSPAAHVDANVVGSALSGVVSLNIRYGGSSFICSGALVGKRTVVSAGHCVDTNGLGACVADGPSCAVMRCASGYNCVETNGVGACVPAGGRCGNSVCSFGTVCCNPLRGICTAPGMFCIQ